MLEWVTRPGLEEVTEEFCNRLHALINRWQGSFPVALTGGESAAVFYDKLAERGVPEQAHFYWSDERVVPPTSPDSNFKLASDHLLRPAGVPEKHIHPAPTALGPAQCARAYADKIRQEVAGGPTGTPQFPLIILGLGEDGHTGSLFPGRDPYADDDLLVRAVAPSVDHPHDRITFTPKLMNAAQHLFFVVTGVKKQWAVEQLRQRTAPPIQVPALVADPKQTRITIFRG